MSLQWFRFRRYGSMSLAVSLVEVLIIWGVSAIVAPLMPQLDWQKFRSPMIYIYVLGFLASLISSIVGLLLDDRRMLAVFALVVAIVNLGVCSVPIAY